MFKLRLKFGMITDYLEKGLRVFSQRLNANALSPSRSLPPPPKSSRDLQPFP